jgi:peptidoglycan L-alanyl-D-glutamate endopeptidase CwlK
MGYTYVYKLLVSSGGIMRGIEKLHPLAREYAEKLLERCRQAGLPVLITETLRTQAEQDALFAQGRNGDTRKIVTQARGEQYESPHQWGVAFDFCKNEKGHEYDDAAFFENVGKLAEEIGLEWGGRWVRFPDRPHLELREKMYNRRALHEKYKTPGEFFKTWTWRK